MIRMHITVVFFLFEYCQNSSSSSHGGPQPYRPYPQYMGEVPLYMCNATDRLISWDIHYRPLWTVLNCECLRTRVVKGLSRQIDQHVLILLYISGCAFKLK